MGTRLDGHIVVPVSILWKLVLREDKKMYRQTGITKYDPSTRNRVEVGLLGKGTFQGNNGKLIILKLPGKRRVLLYAGSNPYLFRVARSIPLQD